MRPCRCGRSAPAGQGRAQAISPLSPSTITFATSSSDPPTMATRRGRGQLPRGRGQLLVTVPDCEGPGTVTSNCPRLCFPRPPPFPHPRPHPFRPGPRLAEPAPGHDQPDAPRPRPGIAGPRLDLPPMCLPPPFLLEGPGTVTRNCPRLCFPRRPHSRTRAHTHSAPARVLPNPRPAMISQTRHALGPASQARGSICPPCACHHHSSSIARMTGSGSRHSTRARSSGGRRDSA